MGKHLEIILEVKNKGSCTIRGIVQKSYVWDDRTPDCGETVTPFRVTEVLGKDILRLSGCIGSDKGNEDEFYEVEFEEIHGAVMEFIGNGKLRRYQVKTYRPERK